MIEFWHWGIAGMVLLILEMVVSGFFLIWLGVAALAVGLLMLVFPFMFWHLQLTIWAVLSLVSFLGWRAWRKKNPVESSEPTLNRRGEQYVGRHFTLEEPIVNGLGKIKVDDSTWKIQATDDLPAGSQIVVTATEGTVLKVKPA
ncbi:MAG: NfeD family protein [Rhodospirillales bacterium]|nr:NfeD family protein [Rhodospirillales bacterium]